MPTHPLAGKLATPEMLIDRDAILADYYNIKPDYENQAQCVVFGTSGHRGKASNGSFNELHVISITQAVCDYRKQLGIDGPLFMGMDTHLLSIPAHASALEVLAANNVEVFIHTNGLAKGDAPKPVPTPVISFSILSHNSKQKNFMPPTMNPAANTGLADGIVITPSHNPPSDGGFKYNPPHGGPADTDCTGWIEKRANALMADPSSIRRLSTEKAISAANVHAHDFITPYVKALSSVLDMKTIAASGLKLGADPMGGASLPYWEPIAHEYGLNLTVVNPKLDPSFSFIPVDHDGKIRMDCSSPWAMSGLIKNSSLYDLSFGNDPDADRHGIVTPTGLMNPNHYLAVAAWYLFTHRPGWPVGANIGKTLVTSGLLDKVAAAIGRKVYEVPVGFKWFVPGLLDASCPFGGEESAGASFLRFDASPWTTDKDGLLMALLSAEITAVIGLTPDLIFEELTQTFGRPYYERKDATATSAQKKALQAMQPEQVSGTTLAGDPITGVFTKAPGNGAPIGGLKVATRNGWFAARPSGTEDIYKIYAESFVSQKHLEKLQAGAVELVNQVLSGI